MRLFHEMNRIFSSLVTYLRLGLINLASVFFYRLKLRLGVYKSTMPIGLGLRGDFFIQKKTEKRNILPNGITPPIDTELYVSGEFKLFSHQILELGSPPNWFIDDNSFFSKTKNNHWSEIPDFNSGEDIKNIWEVSRFLWAVKFAQSYIITGDKFYLDSLNEWLSDWSENNPINQGPNWKCGQETSFRLIYLVLTIFFLKEKADAQPILEKMISEHCLRIFSTKEYAQAQNNNHSVSEAAGMYLGSSYLIKNGNSDNKIIKINQHSIGLLERAIENLISSDGSFSQYSTNYHRLLIDILSLVAFFNNEFNLEKLSTNFYDKASKAIYWLWSITDDFSGVAPNIGANDGSYLLNLTKSDYNDFRPSIQLASVIINGKRLYESKDEDEILSWFKINENHCPLSIRQKDSEIFRDFGLVRISKNDLAGYLKYPNYRFRPSQADIMHLEILDQGKSLISDAGSYSYSESEFWNNYFTGIESHNSIQFDNQQPMRKMRKFLYNDWPSTSNIQYSLDDKELFWQGTYTDYRGCRHTRKVSLDKRKFIIEDDIKGFEENAIVRWRLSPDNWKHQGNVFESPLARIEISVMSGSIKSISLESGWESIYYNKKREISVIRIESAEPSNIKTTIKIKK